MNVCIQCGLPFTSSKKTTMHCSKSCTSKTQNKKRYNEFICRWKDGKEKGMKGKTSISNHIRRYMFEKYNSKCQECGWHKINKSTGNVPLEIEHIDGNHKNNVESNLKLLCPNCHSLTSTYKSLNKGYGRER